MKTMIATFVMLMATFSTFADSASYLMPAKAREKWGFINLEGEWKIYAQFDDAQSFSEGLAAVKYYGNWGFINNAGLWVIEPKYSDAVSFSDGLACVVMNGKWGYIDKKGEWVIPPSYRAVSSFAEGMSVVRVANKYQYINTSGKRAISSAYIKALPFADNLAAVETDEQKFYIDINDQVILRHKFDEAYTFSEGLALVKEKSKYGFINKQGVLVIAATYEDAGYFEEGLCPVRVGQQWGYIDRNEKMVIHPRFEDAFAFSNGVAIVKHFGKFGVINRKGDWVLNPNYIGLNKYTFASTLQNEISLAVQTMLNKWLVKGEFEKSTAYEERIEATNVQKQVEAFTFESIQALAQKRVKLELSSLGLYNADLERFTIHTPGARPFRLPVPIKLAPGLKENWDFVHLSNVKFTIDKDEFVIAELDAEYNDLIFHYDIQDDPGTLLHPIALTDLDNYEISINPIIKPSYKPTQNEFSDELFVQPGQSDVDIDIPVYQYTNPLKFALVIGNQDYGSYQLSLNTETDVLYAETDAKVFADYLKKTLGVPSKNIDLLINATTTQMRQAIARLSAIAKAYDGEAELIVYYAGHGLPDEITRTPYLVPVDVNGSNLEYAIKLDDLYEKLTENPSKRVTVFLDACFSGGARQNGLLASRGVRIKPKSPLVSGNVVVFTATTDAQTAFAYGEKAHGMFTYYLLKGLQLSEGKISYGELSDYLHKQVSRSAVLINSKEQEPKTIISPSLYDTWESFTFFDQTTP